MVKKTIEVNVLWVFHFLSTGIRTVCHLESLFLGICLIQGEHSKKSDVICKCGQAFKYNLEPLVLLAFLNNFTGRSVVVSLK